MILAILLAVAVLLFFGIARKARRIACRHLDRWDYLGRVW